MAERAVVLSANPGRISDIVDIDLDNRNDLRTPEYLAARAKLTKAYEKAAGLDFEAGHASASPSRSPAEMNMPPAAADRAAAI
jgi:hypothetical protein